MHLLSTLILLLLGLATGQGVHLDTVTPEAIVPLHSNSVALEIDVPEGATVFTLSYGHVNNQYSYSRFLDGSLQSQAAERLRLVAFLPEIGSLSACETGKVEATIVVVPVYRSGPGSDDKLGICLPYPDRSATNRLLYQPLLQGRVTLNSWLPVFFGTWLSGAPGQQPVMEPEHAFVIQVGFLTGNSTRLPTEAPLKLAGFLALDELQSLLSRYPDGN